MKHEEADAGLDGDHLRRDQQEERGARAEPEARRRLVEFGPNRVERVTGPPLLARFLHGITHFFALVLWVAAGLAFVADRYDPGAGMGTLGLAIVGVIVLNGAFSFWQEYRAERALTALRQLLPRQVKVVRDGALRPVPAETVVPGDVYCVVDPEAPEAANLEAAVRLARLLALASLAEREVEIDAQAIGSALTAIREQLEVVRQLKSQLTSISNATKAVWTGLDSMRSAILTRVTEAESEIRAAADQA